MRSGTSALQKCFHFAVGTGPLVCTLLSTSRCMQDPGAARYGILHHAYVYGLVFCTHPYTTSRGYCCVCLLAGLLLVLL